MRRALPGCTLILLLAAGLAPGCQEYRFTPVKQCMLAPGTERVTVSTVSSADVLFVVDDSGSMQAKQAKLAASFATFIQSLSTYNQTRVSLGLEPFDFHIAITTTSVFYNPPSGATCAATCGSGSSAASNVCCFTSINLPQVVPLACPNQTECGTGTTCRTDCQGHAGEAICCDSTGVPETTTIRCDQLGAPCGALQDRYVFSRHVQPCTDSSSCATSPYSTCVTPEPTRGLGCGGYVGQMCCATRSCTSSSDCDTGFQCGSCAGLSGVCCASQSPTYPEGQPNMMLACIPGVAVEGSLYPHGSFVGVGPNPRVLHYDKSLYGVQVGDTWGPVADPATATNHQGFTTAQLNQFFEESVNVGTCGSGQEQGLQAGRLAILKALAGRQVDVVNSAGSIVDPPVTADWPHAGAKLVVVYIGDEDDCGSPEDPFRGIVLQGSAGHDTCASDAALPLAEQKEFPVTDMVSYLESLGRPLGAAFIESAAQTTCVDSFCTPGSCCDYQCTGSALTCSTDSCGGQAPGGRFLAAANALTAGGADIVEGSICDPGATSCNSDADCAAGTACSSGCLGAPFGSYCCITSGPLQGTLAGSSGFAPILSRIAEIVKPPSALLLPTQPAAGAVTVLRIVGADGGTRRLCNGPAPETLTLQQAQAQGYDWWFTAGRQQITSDERSPSASSRYLFINHQTNHCEASPGETYSAEYLGLVPASGCSDDAFCASALGIIDSSDPGPGKGWTCFSGYDATGQCLVPSSTTPGTCVCSSRAETCPGG